LIYFINYLTGLIKWEKSESIQNTLLDIMDEYEDALEESISAFEFAVKVLKDKKARRDNKGL